MTRRAGARDMRMQAAERARSDAAAKHTVKTETAGAAFERDRQEALRRLRLLTDAVTAAGRGKAVNWSDASSMAYIKGLLAQPLHHAGVEEFVER